MARLASPSPRPELRHRGQAPAATGGPRPSPTNPSSLHPGLGELSRCPSSKGQRETQTWPCPPGPALPFPTSLPSGPRPSPAPLPTSLLTVSPRFLPSRRRPRSPLDFHSPSGLPLTAPPRPRLPGSPGSSPCSTQAPGSSWAPISACSPDTSPSRAPGARLSSPFFLAFPSVLSSRPVHSAADSFPLSVICLNCTGHTGTRVWGPCEREAASRVQSRLASLAPPGRGGAQTILYVHVRVCTYKVKHTLASGGPAAAQMEPDIFHCLSSTPFLILNRTSQGALGLAFTAPPCFILFIFWWLQSFWSCGQCFRVIRSPLLMRIELLLFPSLSNYFFSITRHCPRLFTVLCVLPSLEQRSQRVAWAQGDTRMFLMDGVPNCFLRRL